MASVSDNSDFLRDQLRHCLNRDRVKLWLPPFTSETGERGTISEEFIQKYCMELSVPDSEGLLCLLEELRLHALEKLRSRKKFKESGLAEIRVRLAGNVPEEVCRCLQNSSQVSCMHACIINNFIGLTVSECLQCLSPKVAHLCKHHYFNVQHLSPGSSRPAAEVLE